MSVAYASIFGIALTGDRPTTVGRAAANAGGLEGYRNGIKGKRYEGIHDLHHHASNLLDYAYNLQYDAYILLHYALAGMNRMIVHGDHLR